MRLILGLLGWVTVVCDALIIPRPSALRRVRRLRASDSDSDFWGISDPANDALVAQALGKIKAAESEVEASFRSRKQYGGKNPKRDEVKSNASQTLVGSATPPRKAQDDSIGFLIDQNKKLNDNDYKTIFDTVAVRGFLLPDVVDTRE